jgi:hypothetical protein
MATKRGYKAPKEKSIDAENGNVDEKHNSGVFSTLDESAQKQGC